MNSGEVTSWHNLQDQYLTDLMGVYARYTRLLCKASEIKIVDYTNEAQETLEVLEAIEALKGRRDEISISIWHTSRDALKSKWSFKKNRRERHEAVAKIVQAECILQDLSLVAAQLAAVQQKELTDKLLAEKLPPAPARVDIQTLPELLFVHPFSGSSTLPIIPDASHFAWNQPLSNSRGPLLIDNIENYLWPVVRIKRHTHEHFDDTAFIIQVAEIIHRKLKNLIRSLKKIIRHFISRDRRQLIRALVPSIRVHTSDGKEDEDGNFSDINEKLLLTFNSSTTWTSSRNFFYSEHNMALAS